MIKNHSFFLIPKNLNSLNYQAILILEWISALSSTFSTTTEVKPLSKAPNPNCSSGAAAIWLPTAPGVWVRALGWAKFRAQIPSMGHHTWPQFTSLSLNLFMSGCTNHAFWMRDNSRQVLLKTQRWISTHCLWSSCTSRRSKSNFVFFMIIVELRLLFHRREGRGEQSSLACKEICTEMSRYEQSCFWQGNTGIQQFLRTKVNLKK